MGYSNNKKIWIDLDNSPHVPFFKPIIDELEKHGYSLTITARDCFQVCGLADVAKIKYKRIGKHYGKHKAFKVLGSLLRVMQLAPTVLRNRPAIAVSHGSRCQQLLSTILRIPNIMIFDYEHATALPMLPPSHVVVPDIISNSAIKFHKSRIHKYPGIKEDVYVPNFKPDRNIRQLLGLNDDDIVAAIRPPASEAHYRSPESEKLFSETVEYLAAQEKVRMVMLPRNNRQADNIRHQWPEMCSNGKIIIPREVVDGLNLMWNADFVISGGGTMNREAAALGIPVYSIFRGKTGAVDRYLAEKGRLIMLETPEDVRTKIQPVWRPKIKEANKENRATLNKIVSVIEEVIKEAA